MKNYGSLNEIRAKHQDLFNYIAEREGDITGDEEFFDRIFLELEIETTDKFNQIGFLLETLQADVNANKTISAIFTEKAKRTEKTIDKIKELALQFMQATNRDKIDGLFRFSLAKNPVSVVLSEDDVQLYPEYLLKTKVEISKTQIKEWMQERQLEVLEIDGKEYARLEQKVSLRIK